ncbi:MULTISPECIES: 2-oxo-4-hydroxy-4-carboxy-5-ureidoimidazoline decarboxylase [Aliiglaciecola]|uniref:2-oxo-4-hydroxy-4-carboxy-5-ureidoimidazoline decarboxylase n=1 Tax=Aliiglaciecola TaxID=1406885 RepID=UPI001C091FFE|nr:MULTISPECIES: 2-oxo-4-hydroxy-4-carboxy-5-ureidoimidazoline decarboxylase [Aliiglaciecola]MBU2876380.1 2-oxo-4-hydroxy-4-carboxy-5-ureidoimidazoline decarboxylase [Aliiglaciecola lipolytica]MDO6710596.1 2-oxo-4-hydroxy-4-carboxy-5-ureidoimidazoline decarboxylase [Aliiglaciecola sp. 2_MG-2023]MDO6751539.1 2-oxo-4-hydroxy-4-carboxy-5-ureidoimidazoline decarboxylase [Aliiglaciecola sp. 1_MG-2023]
MTLDELNKLPDHEAYTWFKSCCESSVWSTFMVQSRPFTSIEQINEVASHKWPSLTEEDYLEAFKAHPMIGDIATLEAKFANTSALAEQEQASAIGADPKVLQELHRLNQQYLEKNQFIFIICATGQSAENMLAAIQKRIHNDRKTEIGLAAEQQLKIALLRIKKGLTA